MTNAPEGRSDFSTPRDHLANERTFLAWLRTSVALVSFGITINRFSLYLTQMEHRQPGTGLYRQEWLDTGRLGVALVLFGVASALFAAVHCKHTRDRLVAGNYHPDLRVIWITTIAVVLFGGFVTIILFYR